MKVKEESVIARLVMKLRANDFLFGYNKASLLQGVLMQRIRPEYAQYLHNQGLKPYSQFLKREGDESFWCVQTLNDEAYKEIIVPLFSEDFGEFYIEHNERVIRVVEKKLETMKLERLMEEFYEESAGRIFRLEFITPTAFKINGKYSFYPDLSHIFLSSMNKFDAMSENNAMFCEETLEQICEVSEIIDYHLRSTRFEMEGVKIPAFLGEIIISIKGNQTTRNFVRLLLKFAEFSGIGIKTAMGMGAVRLIPRGEEGKKDDRKRV